MDLPPRRENLLTKTTVGYLADLGGAEAAVAFFDVPSPLGSAE
jgi:hypothetical protein